MRALVVGASAGVGRAIAAELAGRGAALVVAARSHEALDDLARELRDRHGVEVTVLPLDLTGPDAELRAFLHEATAVLGRIDVAILTAGAVDDDDDGVGDWERTEDLVTVNLLAPLKLGGALVKQFEGQGGGTLVLFSSIAAAAPRRRNVAYAAAKAGLESFARSMRHRTSGTPVEVQVYALGYVDTAMTRGLDLKLPVADPGRVAELVVGRLDQGSSFRYLPRPWGLAVRVLRWLPAPIYDRLRF
jgi:short-subunit dehydrogenase